MAKLQPKEVDPLDGSLAELETFQEALKFDKHGLDDALEIQADIYYRVADKSARAISYLDGAKLRYEEMRAEVDGRIRAELAQEGSGDAKAKKPTEAQIMHLVSLDDDVMAAHDYFLRWKEAAARWDAMDRAFKQRASAMDSLVRLFAAGYFVRASIASAQNSMVDHKAQEGRAALSEHRRRGRGE